MSDFKTIEPVDASILDRITEADVEMWMAARLQQVRETLPAASRLDFNASFRYFCKVKDYYVHWGIHAADKCSGTSPSSAAAFKTVRDALLDNPKARAAEARRKAKDLLDDAEKLEALASGSNAPAEPSGTRDSKQSGA